MKAAQWVTSTVQRRYSIILLMTSGPRASRHACSQSAVFIKNDEQNPSAQHSMPQHSKTCWTINISPVCVLFAAGPLCSVRPCFFILINTIVIHNTTMSSFLIQSQNTIFFIVSERWNRQHKTWSMVNVNQRWRTEKQGRSIRKKKRLKRVYPVSVIIYRKWPAGLSRPTLAVNTQADWMQRPSEMGRGAGQAGFEEGDAPLSERHLLPCRWLMERRLKALSCFPQQHSLPQ